MRKQLTETLSNHPKIVAGVFALNLALLETSTLLETFGNGHPGP